MPSGTGRPVRPIRRTLVMAVTVAVVYSLVGRSRGFSAPETVLAFLAVFALTSGVGVVLYRKDIAALVRTRREG